MKHYTLKQFSEDVKAKLDAHDVAYSALFISFVSDENDVIRFSAAYKKVGDKRLNNCLGDTPTECLSQLERSIFASGENLSVQVPEMEGVE